MLKDFFEEIEDLLGHETLDPRNTLFHEPSKYTVVDGKVVVEPDTPDREVYGHYRTKYMEDKSKGKLKELPGFIPFLLTKPNHLITSLFLATVKVLEVSQLSDYTINWNRPSKN